LKTAENKADNQPVNKKINCIFEVCKLSTGKNIKIPDYRQLILYADNQYVNDRKSYRLLAQTREDTPSTTGCF